MSATPVIIPQANPGAGYRALQTEIDAAVARVLAPLLQMNEDRKSVV